MPPRQSAALPSTRTGVSYTNDMLLIVILILIFLLSMFMLILMFNRMETVGFLRMRRVHVSLLAFFGLIVNFMLRFFSFGRMKFL